MVFDYGFGELGNKLMDVFGKYPPDFKEAEKLIALGADINLTNKYGETILSETLKGFGQESNAEKNDLCGKETCNGCINKSDQSCFYDIISFFIDNGFDTQANGVSFLHSLVFSSYDECILNAAKLILKNGVRFEGKQLEGCLGTIGTEESYQRCCNENHKLENLFYTYYEIVNAYGKGYPFECIEYYSSCIGKRIESVKVLRSAGETKECFSCAKPMSFLHYEPMVICCEDKNVVIKSSPNIYVSAYIFDNPNMEVIDCSGYFRNEVIGHEITFIEFDHKSISHDTMIYGQPIINIHVDNGMQLRFTTNFGEVDKKDTQVLYGII